MDRTIRILVACIGMIVAWCLFDARAEDKPDAVLDLEYVLPAPGCPVKMPSHASADHYCWSKTAKTCATSKMCHLNEGSSRNRVGDYQPISIN